jgi:hypothetical protein
MDLLADVVRIAVITGLLGFLTPSPTRKQSRASPRGEHMLAGRKGLSALSLLSSFAPIGHASFCSDLDTARKVRVLGWRREDRSCGVDARARA